MYRFNIYVASDRRVEIGRYREIMMSKKVKCVTDEEIKKKFDVHVIDRIDDRGINKYPDKRITRKEVGDRERRGISK